MSLALGPFLAGGVSRNNQFNASITPGVAIPAGAMVWVVGGSNVVDTAVISIRDSVNNIDFVLNSFVQLPGVAGSIIVASLVVPQGIPANGAITLTSDTRANWDLNCVYFTGAEGAVFSITSPISTVAITNPSGAVKAQPNMNLFAMLAVLGPSSDGFTQDPLWGTDQKGNVARTNVTVHACGRIVPANADELADYTYAPTLGVARRCMTFVASFT